MTLLQKPIETKNHIIQYLCDSLALKQIVGLVTTIWAVFMLSWFAYQPLLAQEPSPSVYTGVVLNQHGPIKGASVRIQATDDQTYTNDEGQFTLNSGPSKGPITLVASAKGYFFDWASVTPAQTPITMTLQRHHRSDNLDYKWEASINCGECHTAYLEWQNDAHGNSASNHRFQTMYQGTDIHGNRSPLSDYGAGFAKLPDFSKPYYGPGFRTDFPKRDGNCAACHTPLASNMATTNNCAWSGCHSSVTAERSDELPNSISPLGLKGVAAEGISCDFCHKIGRVQLDQDTHLPNPEKPGILSLSIYRPNSGEKLLFGTVDDVSRHGDSYLPLQAESAFCAGCHYGVFSNTLIYNSYGEWLASPYSDPETGDTCQDCHMPVAKNYDSQVVASSVKSTLPLVQGSEWALPAVLPETERNYFVFPWKEGLYRNPEQTHNHMMPGASTQDFLKQAVTMEATAEMVDEHLDVLVNITNDKTGHHVPTGSPLRNMILVVQAFDENGNFLTLLDGPRLPEWTGDYLGEAGKGFAKILQDRVTQQAPTYEHWRLVDILEDTRLPALTTDTTAYQFAIPEHGLAIVQVRLIYRRAFQQLANWKGWDDPDILMAEERIEVGSKR